MEGRIDQPAARKSARLVLLSVLVLVLAGIGAVVWRWNKSTPAAQSRTQIEAMPIPAPTPVVSTTLQTAASEILQPAVVAPASSNLTVNPLAADEAADGFELLFNGRDLTGWQGDRRYWSAMDGAIAGKLISRNRTKNPSCLAWRVRSFADFELRFNCKFLEGHSGVIYRAHDLPDWKSSMGGYEFTLAAGEIGNLVDRVSNKLDRELKPPSHGWWKSDDWNEIVITAQRGLIRHKINGHIAAEVNDTSPSRPTSGQIALKLLSRSGGETATVYFKDIRIKPLDGSARTGK